MTLPIAHAEPFAIDRPPAPRPALAPAAVDVAASLRPAAPERGDRADRADRILLVDDNPRNLQMLLQFLSGRGYTLLVAKTGESAIEIARKSRPAVILLDVMMPGIDGFETCRRLKADPLTRDAAVLFLSAAGETEQKVFGFSVGAVDYITKPIHCEEVVARVTTHLTIRRLNVQLQGKVAEIERELSIVQEMQRRLLPPVLPQIETLDLAAYYNTSRYAGGDYYDVVELGAGRWGILVADVSGHGTPAAVTMSMTRTVFHRLCEEGGIAGRSVASALCRDDPGAMLRAINDHFEYLWDDTGFVTALYAVYDAPARRLRIACAGHNRPLVYRAATGDVQEMQIAATVPLVIGQLPEIPATEVGFEPGDRVLFYTDGTIERTDPGGAFYGAERLAYAMRASAPEPATAAVATLIASADSFAAGREPPDDQTLLLAVVK